MPSPRQSQVAETSPELARETIAPKLSRSGRPIRTSAGKKAPPEGYINTEEAFDNDIDVGCGEESDYDSNQAQHKLRSRKRRREEMCEPRELSQEPEELFDTVGEDSAPSTPSVPHEVSLTFNAPPGMYLPKLPISITNRAIGHVGPFIVKLDLASLMGDSPCSRTYSLPPSPSSRSSPSLTHIQNLLSSPSHGHDVVPSGAVSHSIAGKTGFLDLAPELRNDIYRLALVRPGMVSFPPVSGSHARTAALLATCKQIQFEGAQILYGETGFNLSRNTRPRGRYFDGEWKEVGWKDVRTFLHAIGPVNIANLRTVCLSLYDGVKDRDQEKVDGHRCVQDDHLIASLRLIAAHGQLQKFEVTLRVRKGITRDDHRFLKAMQSIKADQVEFCGDRGCYGWRADYHRNLPRAQRALARMDASIENDCVTKMRRFPKMYWAEPKKEVKKTTKKAKKYDNDSEASSDSDSSG